LIDFNTKTIAKLKTRPQRFPLLGAQEQYKKIHPSNQFYGMVPNVDKTNCMAWSGADGENTAEG